MTEWDVPGYDVVELLGFGSSGEVWRARERSSGRVVALRRLAGGDRQALAEIRRCATVVRSLPSAHVVRLRTTARAGRDDVLVLDHADGGSLAALCARRGQLSAGEVVTALAPIAAALGQAHEHGLIHGRVSASSILLSAEGKPLLDGLGLACLYDPEDGLDPTGGLGASADVWALGALAQVLLTGAEPGTESLAALASTAPLPLVRAVEAALAFDPTTRPSATDLAASLLAACPAAALRGVAAAPLPTAPSSRLRASRAVRRPTLPGAAAVVAVVAVVAVGWTWGAASSPRAATVAPPSATLTEPSSDWRTILTQLDSARAQAFAHADPQRLTEVYAPTSRLLADDTRAVAGLRRLRRTAQGVEHVLHSLTAVRTATDRVELEVVEALAAYDVQDASGTVLASQSASAPAKHVVVLVQTTVGWRVAEVRQAG